MPGKFILKGDVKRDELDFIRLGWLSNPASTGAKHLTVLEGTFFPGKKLYAIKSLAVPAFEQRRVVVR